MTRAQKIVLSVLLSLGAIACILLALGAFFGYEVDGRPLNELHVGIMSTSGSNVRAPSLVLLSYGGQCKTLKLIHEDTLGENTLVVTVTSFNERTTLGRILFGGDPAGLCGIANTTPLRWYIPLPGVWSEIPRERQIVVVLGGQANLYELVTERDNMSIVPVSTTNVKISPYSDDHSISLP
ncbi:MAG TPA: hypothetical protein VLB83_03775 [Candidatus Paceibacterota bacterium]|nr:hypothetical protein [Candidatus Paceibacterota bacterium]